MRLKAVAADMPKIRKIQNGVLGIGAVRNGGDGGCFWFLMVPVVAAAVMVVLLPELYHCGL